MLKPAWYVIDTDWYADLATAARLDRDDEDLIDQIRWLLDIEAGFSPARTVAATHLMLLGAEHLNDAITHAAGLHDWADLARLLHGLNVQQAHLTQTLQRLATLIGQRASTVSDDRLALAQRHLADDLLQAGRDSEQTAGRLRDAHQQTRSVRQ